MKCISLFKCNPQIEVIDKSHCNLEDVPNFQSYSRSLEELFLDANKLTLLNETVFRLTKLRRFSFSDNAIQDIPPDIAKLVNLVELDCSRNRIQNIPEQIKFLRGLQVCDFSGNDIEELPIGLVQLKNLTYLTLNYCLIRKLPDDIGQLKNLESLELRENEIEVLPASITALESLKRLDLGRNLLTKLPDDIGRLKSLEYLLVDANRLETLPPKIGRLENLQCLDLSKQELGFKYLPDEIGGLTSLTDLHLSENHLQSLPDGIRTLKSLTIFKADQNFLNDLNPNIGGCISLQELVLTSNQIVSLPSTICHLTDLRSLNVDSNLLTELTLHIGSLKRLGILSLRDNILTHLPNEIGQLEQAKVLDFCGNQLEYLPISITALNLKALWLSKNQAQPLPKLQIDELPHSPGTHVLTCYLLPQQQDSDEFGGAISKGSHHELDRFVEPPSGGSYGDQNRQPAVSFDTAALDDAELHEDNQLVRHNTPHPKELRARHQKLLSNTAGGHDNASFSMTDNQNLPTSGLGGYPYEYESNGLPEIGLPAKQTWQQCALNDQQQEPNNNINSNGNNGLYDKDCYIKDIVVRRLKNHKLGLGLSIAGGKDTPPYKDNDEGIFVSKIKPTGPAEVAGLRVGDKILAVNDIQFYDGISHQEAVTVFSNLRPDCGEFTMRILRDPNDYELNDEAEVEEDENQDENYEDAHELSHEPLKYNRPTVKAPVVAPKPTLSSSTFSRTYTIPVKGADGSGSNGTTSPVASAPSNKRLLQKSATSSTLPPGLSLSMDNPMSKSIVYTTLVKDYKRDLGLILENRVDEQDQHGGPKAGWSNIVIADILPESIADRDGKLQVDDRLLSINGTDVTGIDLDRILLMLDGTERFIRIVVSRGDAEDPIGNALRNMPTRPSLGSWFSSTSNMTTNRPSLIESFQRPTFGSVTNLQNRQQQQQQLLGSTAGSGQRQLQQVPSRSPSSAGISPKPPKPPKPSHLLAGNSSDIGGQYQSSSSPEDEPIHSPDDERELGGDPVARPRLQRPGSSGNLDDDGDQTTGGISYAERRSVWRQERLKSFDNDVEMARLISEAQRRYRGSD